MLTTITYLQQQQLDLSKITIQDNISPCSSLILAAIDLSGLYDQTQPKTLQMHTSKSTYIFTHIHIFHWQNICNFLSQLLQWFQYENTWYTKSNGTVHTSAKACFTSVTTQIRIRDLDRHQNSIICLSAHCQSSLKIFIQIRLEVYVQSWSVLAHQSIIYDFRAQIQGTGSRSKVLWVL